ncbi:MAG: M20/M25/M40 family metallo-hydrolase, partial [Acidobacteria bacterium]|nr:M20/M25/M40 family metallo-hydrolase [Acidobacteriota bacterium]
MRYPYQYARVSAVALVALLAVAAAAQEQRPAELTGEERLLEVMHTISSHTLFEYVRELASPKYQGRLTGTPGYDAAADWTIRLFRDWGVRPAGDGGGYLQRFPNPYTLVLPGARLELHVPLAGEGTIIKSYLFEQDFFPGSTSDSGEVTAGVVYVGFGMSAPELDYDDYAGVDVKGKLVLVEPEVPVSPDKEPDEFKKWRPYSFHDYKARNAKEHGAAGMIYDYHIANPNCVFLQGFLLSYVGREVVEDLFAGTGRTHREVLEGIRSTRRPASFATGKTVTMKNVTEHHPEGIGANVIGYLKGKDETLKQEAIIVGAHLDHLGLNHELMPGAHDNASGSAVLLGVAEALARSGIPLKRSVVFILFGAEEQGVKGSEYYVAHPFVPNDRVRAFLNLESVGRGERIGAGAGKNYSDLFAFIERNNRRFIHRNLTASFTANLARPRQDAAHFMWAGVPTISFGTSGAKPLPYATYHTTKDSTEIITPE